MAELEKEKIPIAFIYKQDGFFNIEFSDDANKGFEILGFLDCFVKKLKKDLTESLGEF